MTLLRIGLLPLLLCACSFSSSISGPVTPATSSGGSDAGPADAAIRSSGGKERVDDRAVDPANHADAGVNVPSTSAPPSASDSGAQPARPLNPEAMDAEPFDAGHPDAMAAPDSGVPGSDPLASYTTEFNGVESPISEGGMWRHIGADWTAVETSDGNAFGTQTGKGNYDDSYAYLAGFPADQSARGVIHRSQTIDGSCTHEVEILLRWADSQHNARGYECNLAFDGSYAEIVRWNGPAADFTYLGRGSVPGGVHDGDALSASIIGDRITLSVNGVVVVSAQDATFKTGAPGMGFWRGAACGTRGDYGFTSYSANAFAP